MWDSPATMEADCATFGLFIHFPRLDADLYLPALSEGVLESKSWMAARPGGAGGRARRETKAAAAAFIATVSGEKP